MAYKKTTKSNQPEDGFYRVITPIKDAVGIFEKGTIVKLTGHDNFLTLKDKDGNAMAIYPIQNRYCAIYDDSFIDSIEKSEDIQYLEERIADKKEVLEQYKKKHRLLSFIDYLYSDEEVLTTVMCAAPVFIILSAIILTFISGFLGLSIRAYDITMAAVSSGFLIGFILTICGYMGCTISRHFKRPKTLAGYRNDIKEVENRIFNLEEHPFPYSPFSPVEKKPPVLKQWYTQENIDDIQDLSSPVEEYEPISDFAKGLPRLSDISFKKQKKNNITIESYHDLVLVRTKKDKS